MAELPYQIPHHHHHAINYAQLKMLLSFHSTVGLVISRRPCLKTKQSNGGKHPAQVWVLAWTDAHTHTADTHTHTYSWDRMINMEIVVNGELYVGWAWK